MGNKTKILLVLLFLATFFVNNTATQVDIMEARNIVTAREIAKEGNWLMPTMNGELRLEKPPLPTWVAAAVEKVAPYHVGAQRLMAGIMGILWSVFLFLTACFLTRNRRYALMAVVVFLTCYQIMLMGRTATWDIYCHAFMMGAIYGLLHFLYDPRSRRTWAWALFAGLMMGLSFLSKGPVSFFALLLPFLIALPVWKRPSLRGKVGALAVMLLLTIAISSWWYLYLMSFHPEATTAVIHKETGSWVNHNVRPWYYYWRFFAETGVWALLMLAALAVPFWRRRVADGKAYLMVIVWTLAALVLLSFMPEKKMRYLLPMMAPCAMAVAFLLHYYSQHPDVGGIAKKVFQVNGYLIALLVLLAPAAICYSAITKNTLDAGTALTVSILLFGLSAWLYRSVARMQALRFLAGIACLFAIAECFLLGMIGNAVGNPDAHSIREIRARKDLAAIPFYYNEEELLRIELVYEADRRILPLRLNDEKAVMSRLPLALVTQKPVAEELPASLLQRVDTMTVGLFDDNKHPSSYSHYNAELRNYVTILTKQKNQEHE